MNRRGSGHQRSNSRNERDNRPDKRRLINKDRRDRDFDNRNEDRPRKFGRLNKNRDRQRPRSKDEKR